MTLTANDIIEQARADASAKIQSGQDALAREELEHATRHYLMAAHSIVAGLRDAYHTLTISAEYLPSGADAEASRNALLKQLNSYLRGKRLFPLLPQVTAALKQCADRWGDRLQMSRQLGYDLPDHPLTGGMGDLLGEVASWHGQLRAGAGIPDRQPIDEESGDGHSTEGQEETEPAPPPGGMTGVGYDVLLELRGALDGGAPIDDIRTIVRDHVATEADQKKINRIDSLLDEVSLMATRIAAASRASR